MFKIFESSEKKVLRKFDELANQIKVSGGALEVCKKFGNWFVEHELREIIGVVPESQSPFPKLQVMMSALLLLDYARDNRKDGDLDTEIITSYAENAYIASAFLVADEVLMPILKEMQLTGVKPLSKLEQYFTLSKKHKEVWNEFVESDIDLKKFILSLV